MLFCQLLGLGVKLKFVLRWQCLPPSDMIFHSLATFARFLLRELTDNMKKCLHAVKNDGKIVCGPMCKRVAANSLRSKQKRANEKSSSWRWLMEDYGFEWKRNSTHIREVLRDGEMRSDLLKDFNSFLTFYCFSASLHRAQIYKLCRRRSHHNVIQRRNWSSKWSVRDWMGEFVMQRRTEKTRSVD